MKTGFKILLTVIFTAGISQSGFSQFLNASDTSESSVRKYQNIISSNKEIVEFIEYSMVEKGLPRHLRNLALIESNFNRNITSSAGAVGVWQFMSAHANQYGLTEAQRNDLYRSTKTAAISLSDLYRKYNNWVTVVAAYNCGEGNIAKAMRNAGSTQYHVFSKYLPTETVNHVKKYLNACFATGELNAVLTDYNNSRMKKVFLDGSGSGKTFSSLTETEINAGFNLKIVAEELNIEYSQLISWNPELEKQLQEEGEGFLNLPTDLMPDFLLKKNRILGRSVRESSKKSVK
ncbi:lytic murein transglycosylase [Chryseobacterium sp. Leaf404]|uniref:lytic transglycosylase domain-containing protein n=1 Tax=unclassified Chryseobacterium TaxID=2593645 RepID=UPI0006FA0013|nr:MULTISPECIES: lytic transglycosylase domain-containing protein [unclassified Chryseobacterium]KQT15040.1 lytic murein transglycosylase [Chryseobacterium sp. Leaf404]